MRGSAAFRAGVAPGGALAGPWVRNPLWRNARAVPSLDLQLADNKSLVDGVTGKNLVDFTRASSATFTGSDGLIKSAVTNLLLRSEELATSPWFNANVTLTNNSTDVLDPIGGNKSTKIVSTGIASAVGQGATISAASTASIWLRTSSGTASFSLAIYLSSSPFTNIGTANITVTTSWQRFSVTSSTPPSGASYNFQLQVIPVSTTLYAWGAQLEQSSTVGEYIPTTSAINSAPRFDHNPTTGESLGLLVEEARTNLLLRSEEFDNASWTKTRSTVTANATASPTGAVTADKLVEDTTATNTHFVEQFIPVTSGTNYTLSIYAKLAERQHATLLMGGAGFITVSAARFDLSAGTATVTNGAPTASISSAGNGWYRCSITATATSSGGESFQVRTNNGTTTAYTGDGTSGIYLWGAQLE